ncbi:response regulator [Allohahella sp. A8]|uniref:response regulator n=1 Tax=Allohahella sp. A8 TaxID=3141461 RepID=UPI000C0A8981|nr:two-component system response regulator [Hahellaceae bacterium]|tara:strand:- start:3729 stop:4091 length:363 start_codon:yes stop_codon:yes gene_type:complete
MGKKILIVDDSEADLKHLEQIVSGASYTAITAKSGQEAIERAKSEKPSLILLDIIMQGMDGFSACREMSRDPALAGIPIVFVSSKNQKADHLWASRQGAKGLISKPYQAEEILTQLRHYA